MTADGLIDALGGTFVVAAELSVIPSRVSNWRSRGKIPDAMWTEIVGLAASRGVKGITFEQLASMHARCAAEARS